MKRNKNIKAMRLLGLLMICGIVVLCVLIYRDFSANCYESWGRALMASMSQFESNLAGR